MRRITILFLTVLAVSLLTGAGVDACGDKLMRIGRGARFQRSIHPAVVLIYLPPNAPADISNSAHNLEKYLRKAGHHPNTVQGPDQLGAILNSKQFDVIISGLAQADDIQQQLQNSSAKPVLVPIVSKPNAATKKQYRCLVRDPNNGDQYLEAIEAAMKSKARA